MRTVLGWTILSVAAITLIAAAPREHRGSIVSPSAIADMIAPADDHADEIFAAIQPLVAGDPPASVDPHTWESVRAFYTGTDRPAWVDAASTAHAVKALDLLQNADAYGLNPADYRAPDLASAVARADTHGGDSAQADQLAALDVEITSALLAFGQDVSLGRTRPQSIDRQWKSYRAEPDLAGTLRADAGDLRAWVRAIQPSHPQYLKLLAALTDPAISPDPEALRLVRLNLDRWRWMPDTLGENHLFVNIPAYELRAQEDDRTAFTMRVIVGKPAMRTPVLSSEMNTVVFSPYWHIPTGIAAGETVPEAAQDPDYLRKRGIEVIRVSKSGSAQVDPGEIDWSDAAQVRQLSFRQRPGPQNALGFVKFLFPNPFDVYLHDTPTDGLFSRTRRALSHGCVRLEDPEGLAKYVLRADTRWDGDRIVTAMHSGNEQSVRLAQTLPVHIGYFTAWVTEDGTVAFYPDVYGYDKTDAPASKTLRTN